MAHNHAHYDIYTLSDIDIDELRFHADAGDAESQVALGYCYEHGFQVETDAVRAFELYSAAAAQGFANGIYNRGVCIGFGIGTEKSARGYFACIKRAAELGFAPAQNDLGWCYECGIEHGCVDFRDERLAFSWYEKSARQGHQTAIVNIVRCYRDGVGTAPDEQKAQEWERELR